MENLIKINDQLSVQGQLTKEQVEQLPKAGFKSILNLRFPNEDGFLADEQQRAEAAGLQYQNIPVNPAQIDDELSEGVLNQLDSLEKPILIHCKSGMRAGLMGLLYIASRQGMTAAEALETGKQLGFNFEANPQFKQFIESYLSPS